MMGPHLDPLKKALAAAMNRLNKETENTLRELLPAVEPASVKGRRPAPGQQGRLAQRIEAISPLLWKELEKKSDPHR